MEEKQNKGLHIVYIVATALLFASFFAYLFSINLRMNLNDPDVWWHIKTGEYVMQNHVVPDQDPFAFTTPVPLSRTQKIGLRANWLGQVMFAMANNAKGLYGVVLLRNILIIMPMLILLFWLLRRNVSPWVAFSILSLPALMLSVQLFYSFERPQGLSFNLILITAILLERVRIRTREKGFDHSYWLLPLFIALWANIHAGYIVGNIIICIYMVADTASALFREVRAAVDEPLQRGRYARIFSPAFLWDVLPTVTKNSFKHVLIGNRRFYLVCGATLLASGLNPNGYYIFITYASGLVSMFVRDVARYTTGSGGGGWVSNVVLEYKPLYYFYINLEYKWLIFYWAYSVFAVGLLLFKYWFKKSVDLAELLTVSFVVLFANMYARGIMFSLTVIPLYVAKSLIELADEGKRHRLHLRVAMAVSVVIMISFATYSFQKSPAAFKRGVPTRLRYNICVTMAANEAEKANCKTIVERARIEASNPDRFITPWYPTLLSKYIKLLRPDPPMYNYYTWGGFLIYSLYPDYQVFIDGRAIDDKMTQTADFILKSYPGWKENLDSGYGVNFVAIPVLFRESGHIIPLAVSLAKDSDWSLVFIQNNSALLLRNRPVGSRSTMKDWDTETVSKSIQKNRDIIKETMRRVKASTPKNTVTGGLDKRLIYKEILQIEEMFLRGSPYNPTFNIAKADALFELGNYAAAKDIYLKFPNRARQQLMTLRSMGY